MVAVQHVEERHGHNNLFKPKSAKVDPTGLSK
eukprot:CAMPEP_0178422004 /NCGR_PEP_ID=MMETSP0689_2-20121128/26947_1 /TAXON_ID=160604 /ORGANISM="Amphidinium massartii, Strain CS-259" /LENGTH=31 /DNA_ID= /DNA_START= /DNA_END= /DNA_ORIENTATION=